MFEFLTTKYFALMVLAFILIIIIGTQFGTAGAVITFFATMIPLVYYFYAANRVKKK